MLAWELGWIGTVQRFVASDLAFQAFWGQNLGVMFYFVDLHLHLWCGIVIGVNKVSSARYERLWLCFMLRVTWEIFSFFLYCVPICICICVACFSVSRLAVRGVRGSVVTILMAAIAEQSHSVIYRPTPHVWRHISKHRWRGLYSDLVLLALYSQRLTNSLVGGLFGFHGQCTRTLLWRIYCHIQISQQPCLILITKVRISWQS